jgi:hypothetical protein
MTASISSARLSMRKLLDSAGGSIYVKLLGMRVSPDHSRHVPEAMSADPTLRPPALSPGWRPNARSGFATLGGTRRPTTAPTGGWPPGVRRGLARPGGLARRGSAAGHARRASPPGGGAPRGRGRAGSVRRPRGASWRAPAGSTGTGKPRARLLEAGTPRPASPRPPARRPRATAGPGPESTPSTDGGGSAPPRLVTALGRLWSERPQGFEAVGPARRPPPVPCEDGGLGGCLRGPHQSDEGTGQAAGSTT